MDQKTKDYIISDIIEGNTIMLPSFIKILKSDSNWKRETYNIIISDRIWTFLEQDFKTDILEYEIDMV